jgi:hypothetical protein
MAFHGAAPSPTTPMCRLITQRRPATASHLQVQKDDDILWRPNDWKQREELFYYQSQHEGQHVVTYYVGGDSSAGDGRHGRRRAGQTSGPADVSGPHGGHAEGRRPTPARSRHRDRSAVHW